MFHLPGLPTGAGRFAIGVRMVLLLLACAGSSSGDPTLTEAVYAPPDAPGPFAVGTYEGSVSGSSGVTLPVQVWYPTLDSGAGTRYDGVLDGAAITDATPECGVARPVLMFSHGSGGVRYQSIFFTEYLATHGWVVVAPDHVGNTAFDDGDVPLEELMQRRPMDIRDSFDWLLGESTLADCVDPDGGYAMAGHSFGGFTTLAVTGAGIDLAVSRAWCAENDGWLCGEVEALAAEHGEDAVIDLADPRAWAGIAMAPAGYEVLVGGLPDIAVPLQFLGGTRDTLTPVETEVRPLYTDAGGQPRSLGVLTDAGHYTFSDACEMLPVFDDCEAPYLDPAVAHPLVATVSTAFLLERLGVDVAGWLPPTDPAWTWETAE